MQDVLQVTSVTLPICRLHNHFVDIYLNILPILMGEYYIHESLVCVANVFEAERHDIEVVVATIQHECGFGYIQVGVHET